MGCGGSCNLLTGWAASSCIKKKKWHHHTQMGGFSLELTCAFRCSIYASLLEVVVVETHDIQAQFFHGLERGVESSHARSERCSARFLFGKFDWFRRCNGAGLVRLLYIDCSSSSYVAYTTSRLLLYASCLLMTCRGLDHPAWMVAGRGRVPA